jgi:serine/threonine-protein kinase
LAEALAHLKQGHQLGSKRPNWPYPSAQWVQHAERLLRLDGKLPALLRGQARPADAAEQLDLAELCRLKKQYAAAARFAAEAFAARPSLADDHRYDAACFAALAAAGQGEDASKLADEERSRWRQQALDWLRAELAAYRKLLEDGKPGNPTLVKQRLPHWRQDSALAGIRDKDAVAKLPAEEQKACQQLWAEVETVLAKAQGKPR